MIYISIGSNLGDRLYNIQKALELIKSRIIPNIKCSIVIETQALLKEGAPTEWNKPFFNAICYGEANTSPQKLLDALKSIESELGRPLSYDRWSPRVIDLDILLFDNVLLNEPDLSLPHPEIKNRQFLLHLLSMINPALIDPISHKPFADCLEHTQSFSKAMAPYPQLVGILNVTSDSFSDGGLYLNPASAISHARTLHAAGASIIDIGAQSTRPNAKLLSSDEEYNSLKPVLEKIDKEMRISLDSFSNDVIKKVLSNHKITWINDQSGNLDQQTLEMIAGKDLKLVLMRSLSLPAQKNAVPNTKDPVELALVNLSRSIERAIASGITESNIIVDPGIGFDHSPYQDISILRRVSEIKKLGFPILVGHSRKSCIQTFSNSSPRERDIETIAISSLLDELGVDFIRVHNIEGHQKFFTAKTAINAA